jgi:REP element-mobilizing transposase RayT
MHVTLRSAFRPLRSKHVFPTLRIALARANRRDPERFRVVHFSVQYDHVHLIVEASDEWALSSGMRSVAIRMARYVNELVSRKGRFWADRWFGRALTSPRQVRNALAYVLQNFRKHARSPVPGGVDPFSSGLDFDGWRGFSRGGRAPPLAGRIEWAMSGAELVSKARSWLAAVGWRVHGLVRIDEVPRGA